MRSVFEGYIGIKKGPLHDSMSDASRRAKVSRVTIVIVRGDVGQLSVRVTIVIVRGDVGQLSVGVSKGVRLWTVIHG